MKLRRRRKTLVDRLRPYADDGQSGEAMVSADPIRMFLHGWMIETGDPVEVVAKGFDLGVREVSEILLGQRPRIPVQEDQRIRDLLRLDPSAFGPSGDPRG